MAFSYPQTAFQWARRDARMKWLEETLIMISGEDPRKAIWGKLLIWELPDRVRKPMPITAWGECQLTTIFRYIPFW
jgi:hypothetical protein